MLEDQFCFFWRPILLCQLSPMAGPGDEETCLWGTEADEDDFDIG
jgi:hypothetical protein